MSYNERAHYWRCETWSEDALKKGLHHDFVTLERPSVMLHYAHNRDQNCNDRCKLKKNPKPASERKKI